MEGINMEVMKEVTTIATPNRKQRLKSNDKSLIIKTVKAVFQSGQKVTAKELNSITGSNDARKQISDLRKMGWNITDTVLPGGCKLYWLVDDERQFNILKEGGEE